jgi:hypothetical protein
MAQESGQHLHKRLLDGNTHTLVLPLLVIGHHHAPCSHNPLNLQYACRSSHRDASLGSKRGSALEKAPYKCKVVGYATETSSSLLPSTPSGAVRGLHDALHQLGCSCVEGTHRRRLRSLPAW